LPEFYQAIKAIGLGAADAATIVDVTACPGTDTCKLGIASSRSPNPTQARLKSLVTHTVFGVGLYVCALVVSYLLRAAA